MGIHTAALGRLAVHGNVTADEPEGRTTRKPITFDDYAKGYECIRLEWKDGILEMTLHTAGKSLVFDKTIHDELGFAFADIGADRVNKVVILTGAGDNFCAEFDPKSFEAFKGLGKDITAAGWDQTVWRGRHNLLTQLEIPVPMIGVVNGPAIAQSELALLYDITLASDTNFNEVSCMPYVNIQITAGATREQKAQLVKDVTDSLIRVLDKKPEHTHVVIQEIAEEDWGDAGQLTDDWKRRQSSSSAAEGAAQ